MAYTPIRLSEEELLERLPKNIGQVSLNYDYYPGEDLYSDGEIEDRLLDIVKNSSRVEYQGIIEKSKSWPILYHLSPLRGNIVDFLPIGPNDKVLEIGSGCGAITDTLSQKAGSVTCVDLSAKRSQINAYRNRDRDNITIYVGNFTEIEPHLDNDFDYVLLIGVFEYGASYIPSKTPYKDFLNIILKHVKQGGRCAIAIENKFGLKYWAGCKEDHNGEYFSSLEGYPRGGSARTFTRVGLEKIFESCNVKDYSFYYPYPDYKLPHTVYSDRKLPAKGELTDNLRNLDRDRMMLFNESYVYDSILEDGQFPLFSNSYMVVIGPSIDVSYAKFSNDRSYEYSISTTITSKGVVKRALNDEAKKHIYKLKEYSDLLIRRYEGSRLKVNPCTLSEDGLEASFPFEKGCSLEELMDEALFGNNQERFNELFDKYYQLISYNNNVDITDYDLIFSNILVDGDNWTLIDYEWSQLKQLDSREVAFRAVYCYLLEDERRNKLLNVDNVLAKLNISNNEAEYYREKEYEFQKNVTGRHESIGEIRATIGTYALDAEKLADDALKRIIDERIKLYYDRGNGFSEEDSEYIPDVYVEKNHVQCDINFDGNLKNLRIDPADLKCLVRINELVLNGNNVLKNKKFIESNGKTINYGTYAFNTMDPNLILRLNEVLMRGENVLHLDMEVTPASEEMLTDISNSVKKLF